MKKLAVAIIGLTSIALPISAIADQPPARHLLENCTSDDQMKRTAFCGLYISGFTHALEIVTAETPIKKLCLPNYFSGEEARLVFVRFMLSHKGKIWDAEPSVALWVALTSEFPCRKNQAK